MMLHFPRIYACPFCRHHMNAYVFKNGEPEMYPLEWTILGIDKKKLDVERNKAALQKHKDAVFHKEFEIKQIQEEVPLLPLFHT